MNHDVGLMGYLMYSAMVCLATSEAKGLGDVKRRDWGGDDRQSPAGIGTLDTD
jgi:hypothetical protein